MPACNCDEQAPCCHNCKYRQTQCSFQTFSVNSPATDRWAQKPGKRAVKPLPSAKLLPVYAAKEQDNYLPLDGAYQQELNVRSTSFASPESTISLPTEGVTCSFTAIPRSLTCVPNLIPEEHELMHHYSTTVFASLADYEVYRPIWQVIVPREMQSVNFLKHGVLAISALHIHYLRFRATKQPGLNPLELEHKDLAQKHYQAAVMEFGSLFPEDIMSNTSAVFAFSHLTIFFAFGSSHLSGHGGTMSDAIDDLLSLFVLTRKAMAFLRMKWDLLQKGDMGILLQRGPQITDRNYLPTDVITALELVEELCHRWTPTQENPEDPICQSQINEDGHDTKSAYRRAISQLWDCFVMLETKRKDWGMALRFPMIFPDTLFSCFRAREPLAMVILAHYCVLLRRAPVRWWADGWSIQVIQAIFQDLPQNWRYAVSWPMSVSGLSPTDIQRKAQVSD
ncbi:hypothetical protein MferCBS31731_005454 [Microsporum ferrugineum]